MKYSARDIALGGMFGALGVAIPILFHLVGLGQAFLPMHLPLIVCGMLVAWPVAFAVGVVTPIISSALTGMPPLPMAALMPLELGVLAASASILRRSAKLPVVISLVLAILVDRFVLGVEMFALAPVVKLPAPPAAFLITSLVTGWPGVVVQLVAVPAIMASIRRADK